MYKLYSIIQFLKSKPRLTFGILQIGKSYELKNKIRNEKIMMYQIVPAVMLTVVYVAFKVLKVSHAFVKSILSVALSLGLLMVLNIISEKIGIFMPLNLASVFAAGVLGIPGICLMIILNVIL